MTVEITSLVHPRTTVSVSLAISQTLDGSYMAGRSVVRKGVPVSAVEESMTLGVADSRWGSGLTLEDARSVVADAVAHLGAIGFQPNLVRSPAKAKPSTGMGL